MRTLKVSHSCPCSSHQSHWEVLCFSFFQDLPQCTVISCHMSDSPLNHVSPYCVISVSLYCTNSIQTFCHVSHLLKTETKTILWHIFLLVTILFWTSNELNACVSCLLFFSDPLPGMQSFRGCFLHSDSECSQEEGHSAPLSPTGCLQLFLLTWRDHQAASVTVARTLSFRTLLYLTLE